MELFIAAVDDEDKRCFFDVSVTDINTSPKFTTKDKITANFLNGSRSLNLGGCEKFLLMDNEQLSAVYYPTKKRVKILPTSAIRLPQPPRPGLKADAKFNCTGIGKESQTGDFRVIRNVIIKYHDGDRGYAGREDRFEIYSMKTDSWREMKVDGALPATALLSGFGSILIGDVHYWIATGLQVPGRWGIVGFNFTSEKFLIWGLSPQVDKKHCLHLIKLDEDETLGLISYSNPCYPLREFIIWAVRGGGETGFKKRHAFTLQQPVESPVGFIGGRLLFIEEKLSKNPTDPLYRLNVFDVLTETLMPLDFYSHQDNMQVISYKVGEAPLPQFSECNIESEDGDDDGGRGDGDGDGGLND